MFLLEDRILFDAAVAIDIAEVQQHEDSINEPSDDFDNIESTEQTAEAFLQSPYEAQQTAQLPINPYIDAVVRDALDGNLAALGLDGVLNLPETASATESQIQVLLISNSLANADELYETAGENTLAIRYDAANTTTEQLLAQIEQSLNGEKIDRIGIAQESDSNGKVDLLTNDSDTELWQGLNELMAEDATIDLFASNMNDSEFSDALETLTGHEVNYSTDITGSNGDWVLENGDVNLADTYFDGEVAQNVNFSVIPAEPVHELAIINSSVMDAENIIDDLGDNVDVLILDGNVDPLDQINEYLDTHDNLEYDAMHIISHGNDGYFVLNGRIVDGDYATDNADAFAAIGEHLTDDGDIMIYGCDLAANAEGQSLVAQLADLTGADIAASIDTTSNIGGDWNLEYTIGLVDSSAFIVEGYDYHLANQIVTVATGAGAGTLRQAVADVGTGEEITFNIAANDTVDIGTTDIDITKSMSINGYNNATTNNVTVQVSTPGDGGTDARVFNITAGNGNDVVIENMNIKGGDILSNGDTTAGHGGSIYMTSGSLTLNNVDISGSKSWDGGGIANYGDDSLTIAYSTIHDNYADNDGGGIFNNSAAALTILSSTIANNTSGDNGGGIINYNNSGDLIIVNSTISGNTADNDSGGISIRHGDAYMVSSTVINNGSNDIDIDNDATLNTYFSRYDTAQVSGTISAPQTDAPNQTGAYNNELGPLADNGGDTLTMAVLAGSSMINNGTFAYNTNNTGDGYYFIADDGNYHQLTDYATSTVTEPAGKITSDQRGDLRASTPSIGSYEYNAPSVLQYRTIADGDWSTISIWETSNDGGTTWIAAIDTPDSSDGTIAVRDIVSVDVNVTIDETTIDTGAALTVASGISLAIADGAGTDLTVTGSFANNGTTTTSSDSEVSYNGGNQTIVAIDYSELTITGSGTTKTFADGTTSVAQEIAITESLTLTGSSADNVTVQVTDPGVTDSRVFNLNPGSGNTVDIENITIKGGDISGNGNATAGYGGAIYVASGTLNLDNAVISDSTAHKGGAIYNDQATVEININGSLISGNHANDDGGAIYNKNGDLNIAHTTIDNNSADDHAGGIYHDRGDLFISYSTLSNNSAGDDGGAINSRHGYVSILNTTISGNSAVDDGGGIFLDRDTMDIINTTISDNQANDDGGGIATNRGTVTTLNSAIINNNANDNGDDIKIKNDGTANVYLSRYYDIDNDGSLNEEVSAPNEAGVYVAGELGILADNGGDTETMAVDAASAMVANGTIVYYNNTDGYYFIDSDSDYRKVSDYNTFTPTAPATDKIEIDQRGGSRSVAPTMGAYEYKDLTPYRTINDGDWSDISIWETNVGTDISPVWVSASETPTSDNAYTINVRNMVALDTDVSIDQSIIDTGEILTVADGITLTIADGAGTDLTINGQLTVTGDLVISSSATATTAAGSYVLYNGGNQNIAVISYAKLGLEGDNTTKTFGDGITSVTEEILLTSAGMTLTGSGAANATVQVATPGEGGTVARLFHSNPGSGNTLTIENITMKGGDISGLTDEASFGGTIFHESGTLDINNAVISSSKAVNGGAVYSASIINISGSTVSSGHATNNGGGLYNSYSEMTVTATTIDNNLADRSGGGISSYQDVETTVDDSTISNNNAGRYGGILSYDSTLIMVNSTVSGNIASSIVGGVGSFKGSISLLNTTISNNTASVAFGTVYNNRSQLYLINSILIDNPLSGGGDDNAIQTSSAGGDSFAFYSWYDGTKIVGNLTTNVTSPNLTSPSDGTLGALADNGGSTWTMEVQAGSNIIETGTYIYHNFIDGYYFSNQTDTTFYHLNHDEFTPFFPGGKITDDQRELTRDPVLIPTMGAYEVNTTMVDELPDSTEYASDEFSDMLKVHKATENDLDIALMKWIA